MCVIFSLIVFFVAVQSWVNFLLWHIWILVQINYLGQFHQVLQSSVFCVLFILWSIFFVGKCFPLLNMFCDMLYIFCDSPYIVCLCHFFYLSELGRLSKLTTLVLSNNQLSGSIPAGMVSTFSNYAFQLFFSLFISSDFFKILLFHNLVIFVFSLLLVI